jgi:nitroreductase
LNRLMLDILQKRRSISKFEPRPVEPAKIEALIESALRAPSSRGRNPWEFVVVTDPAVLKALSQAKQHGSEFLARAPLAVIIAADPECSDVWVEDCAIAAIILQLTAVSLGLGSCWAQIRLRPHDEGRSAEAHVREVVGLPERLAVDAIVGIGYPGEVKLGHAHASLPFEKVHRERFSRC